VEKPSHFVLPSLLAERHTEDRPRSLLHSISASLKLESPCIAAQSVWGNRHHDWRWYPAATAELP